MSTYLKEGWALIQGWALINFSAFRMGAYSRWALNSRLGAYSNKYGIKSYSSNQTPATWLCNFVNHSYDYRPNWTPLSPKLPWLLIGKCASCLINWTEHGIALEFEYTYCTCDYTNRISAPGSSDFVHHSFDYRPK